MRIMVRATDAVSAVTRLQITNEWPRVRLRPYRWIYDLLQPGPEIFVRVRDRAGNYSRYVFIKP